jgi:hypothetical protein
VSAFALPVILLETGLSAPRSKLEEKSVLIFVFTDKITKSFMISLIITTGGLFDFDHE